MGGLGPIKGWWHRQVPDEQGHGKQRDRNHRQAGLSPVEAGGIRSDAHPPSQPLKAFAPSGSNCFLARDSSLPL